MTLPKEDLDNKAFGDLLKEAISRIPVYSPEWTDHNIHDPGITFIELFAWLTEMQIYRLNRINDKSYRKFLKLMGIPKLRTARAAKVDVTFSLLAGVMEAEVPAGTIVTATDPVTGEDILFQTEQDLKVINTRLTVLSYHKAGNVYINNTEANENDDVYYYAFGTDEPKKDDELYIGFKDDPGKDIDLAFYLLDDEPFKKENSTVVPLGTLIWEYYNNLSPGTNGWKQLEENRTKDETKQKIEEDGIKDETKHLTISGKVNVRINKNTPMKKTDVGEAKDLYWLRCRVADEKGYQVPPKIDCILLNTVPATHAIQRNGTKEFTFPSNGKPNYHVDLKCAPLMDNTLTVKVIDEVWKEVKDFDASKEEDKHYTVDRASGRVTFGNGIHGKIPPKGTDNITVSYKECTFSSKGLPDFYIDLKYAPVLDNMFTVNVNELWTEVENFNASKPEDRHYTVDRDSGKVTFGNGVNSRIPPEGIDNITVSYLVGGSVPNDAKFSSNGKPGFFISLSRSPVLGEKLIVNINEPWTEIEDFDASKPGDTHYTVDLTSGRVTFGNGINGKIPPKGTDNITVSYFSGGGTRGNVKPGAITKILSKNLLGKVTVNNEKEASGGMEAETLGEAVQRVRTEMKEVTRAVKSADYEYLALHTPGVQVVRAKALPRYHPSQNGEVPGIISVIVVPKDSSNNPNPMPSQDFLKAVYWHLEEYRLLATELFVLPPVYVEISVTATIGIKPKSLDDTVIKDVKKKLKDFLHPISPGGFDGKGWPFGRSVYLSEIYEKIDSIDGVDYVEDVTLSGKNKSETGDIVIPSEGLVYLKEAKITVAEEEI